MYFNADAVKAIKSPREFLTAIIEDALRDIGRNEKALQELRELVVHFQRLRADMDSHADLIQTVMEAIKSKGQNKQG